MNSTIKKAGAGLIAGVLSFSMLLTTAYAVPQDKKDKKPPVKKTDKNKKDKGKKPGDNKELIASGKKVYDKNGCEACHAIGGKGGMSAPELTKVAAEAKHTSKWLEQHVVNPKSHTPEFTMPPYEDSIKGKDLKALAAYLSSLK